jgi:hypothetical protein
VVLAGSVLVVLGAAYYLTCEPSADIGIAWRPGISIDRQRDHERRFALVNGRMVQGRMRYDLLDLRKQNIEAIVSEADVLDTDGIDRTTIDLPPDYRYGRRWTWIVYRLPLRYPAVVAALAGGASLIVLAVGLVRLTRRGQAPQRRVEGLPGTSARVAQQNRENGTHR